MPFNDNTLVLAGVGLLVVLILNFFIQKYVLEKKMTLELKKSRGKMSKMINDLYKQYNEDMYTQHINRKQKMTHLHEMGGRRSSRDSGRDIDDDQDGSDSIDDVGGMDYGTHAQYR